MKHSTSLQSTLNFFNKNVYSNIVMIYSFQKLLFNVNCFLSTQSSEKFC